MNKYIPEERVMEALDKMLQYFRSSYYYEVEKIKQTLLSTAVECEEVEPRIYPCAMCGVMRTKSEGGTIFTVCDECWEKKHPPRKPSAVECPGCARLAAECMRLVVEKKALAARAALKEK